MTETPITKQGFDLEELKKIFSSIADKTP